jgi:hypothetical protein
MYSLLNIICKVLISDRNESVVLNNVLFVSYALKMEAAPSSETLAHTSQT